MIQTILSNDWTTDYNKNLYIFFKEIFIDAEFENPGFYDMTYAKQKAIINTLVEKYMKLMEKTGADSMSDYSTQADVKDAFTAGEITEPDAISELVDNYKMAEADAKAYLSA